MKLVMSMLVASTLIGGAAVPASASDSEVMDIVREYVKVPSADAGKYVRVRKFIPQQPEYIADEMEIGSKEWWRQMDRERRGGRR
jgi:hypothetical protein